MIFNPFSIHFLSRHAAICPAPFKVSTHKPSHNQGCTVAEAESFSPFSFTLSLFPAWFLPQPLILKLIQNVIHLLKGDAADTYTNALTLQNVHPPTHPPASQAPFKVAMWSIKSVSCATAHTAQRKINDTDCSSWRSNSTRQQPSQQQEGTLHFSHPTREGKIYILFPNFIYMK